MGEYVSPKSVAAALAQSPRQYDFPIGKLEKAVKLAEQGALKWQSMGQRHKATREMAASGAKKWLNKARGKNDSPEEESDTESSEGYYSCEESEVCSHTAQSQTGQEKPWSVTNCWNAEE